MERETRSETERLRELIRGGESDVRKPVVSLESAPSPLALPLPVPQRSAAVAPERSLLPWVITASLLMLFGLGLLRAFRDPERAFLRGDIDAAWSGVAPSLPSDLQASLHSQGLDPRPRLAMISPTGVNPSSDALTIVSPKASVLEIRPELVWRARRGAVDEVRLFEGDSSEPLFELDAGLARFDGRDNRVLLPAGFVLKARTSYRWEVEGPGGRATVSFRRPSAEKRREIEESRRAIREATAPYDTLEAYLTALSDMRHGLKIDAWKRLEGLAARHPENEILTAAWRLASAEVGVSPR